MSDLSRSLFSWRSSSYGTCVRFSSSTQLQVETAKTVRNLDSSRLVLLTWFCCDVAAGSLLLQLLDWVRLHKSDVDTRAREVLQSDSPAQHQSYWDVVWNTWPLTSRTSEHHHPCPYVCVCVCAGDQFSPAGPYGWSPSGAVQTGVSASGEQLCVQTHGRPVTDHAHI